jgi:nucleotide-binding universal stress UspA family protein
MNSIETSVISAPEKQHSSAMSFSNIHEVKNILMTVDFSTSSNAVVENGVRLAHLFGAKLIALHVFEYAYAGSADTGGIVDRLIEVRQKAERQLNDFVRGRSQEGLRIETIVRDGLASEAILSAIEEKGVDLAIMGTANHHGMERFVFGSTAEAVLRKASCPLLTFGPEARDAALRGEARSPVVFATDLNPKTSHSILYADLLSRALDAPLQCIQVLPSSVHGDGGIKIIPQIMTSALEQIVRENGVEIERSVCSIAYGDDVAETIVRNAKEHEAQLIVLGIHRARAFASHLPAHITYRIIAAAPCPVLTVSF